MKMKMIHSYQQSVGVLFKTLRLSNMCLRNRIQLQLGGILFLKESELKMVWISYYKDERVYGYMQNLLVVKKKKNSQLTKNLGAIGM